MKILTISIAAYNVENFLEETLNTLCDKRYIDDIEILVIDDGSTDNTGSIAKSYQDRYPHSIKYVAKENGGHGSTINKGMELAKGKYFRILDGDDYVDQEGFFEYIQKLKRCDTDIVITDYWWVDNIGNKYPHNHSVFSEVMINKERTFDKKMDSALFGLSTLSIKTNLLKKANFKITEKCFYVDVEFIIWAIFLSRNYIYFNDKVYMYRCVSTTQNSVNKVNMLKNVKMQEKVALNLCEIFEEILLDKRLNNDKKVIILNRITMNIGATYRTYLLCKKSKESKKQIMDFDRKISNVSKSVYEYTKNNRFIYLLRMHNFMFITPIRAAYNGFLALKNR